MKHTPFTSYSRCHLCGKEIQVHPTNWWGDNHRVCIPCQNKLRDIGAVRKIEPECCCFKTKLPYCPIHGEDKE